MKEYILKPEEVPNDSIIIATDQNLGRLEQLAGNLESYLSTCISHNGMSGTYRLHLIFKLQIKIQGESYNERKRIQ